MQKWIIVTIYCLVTQVVYAQETPLIQQLQNLMRQGEDAHQIGDYENAFEYYAQAAGLVEQIDSSNTYYLWLNVNLADILYQLSLRNEAIARSKMVLLLIRRHYPYKIPEQVDLTRRLGRWYLEAGKYDSALVYMKEGLKFARLADSGTISSQYNNIGMVFEKAGLLDSALIYYKHALNILGIGNTVEYHLDPFGYDLKYSILDNIGEIYFTQKNYQEAFNYFEQCYEIAIYNKNSWYRKAQSHIQFSRVFLALKQFKEAEKELLLAEEEIQNFEYVNKIHYRMKLNKIWIELYKNTNRYQLAFLYQVSYNRMNDSIADSKSRLRERIIDLLVSKHLNRVNIELKLEQETRKRKEQELVISRQQTQFNRVVTYSIGILSMFLILTGILYMRMRQKKMKTQAEALEVKNRLNEVELKNKQLQEEKLIRELNYKQQDISDLTLYLSNLRSFHDSLILTLAEIKKMDPESQIKALKTLLSDASNRLDLGQKTSMIHAHIEEINQEFYNHLQQKHPELTKVDWELCGLIRLNMDNKEIAAIKSIDPNSVKRSKTRLRKKLGLSIDQDMQLYLKNI